MMYLKNSNQIQDLASKITGNSDLFGGEVSSVIAELTSLWNDATTFGCSFTREIPNMWGSSVVVTAVPEVRKSAWSF